MRTEYDSAVEREIQADFAKMHQQRIDNDRMRWQLTLVFAIAVMGVLGLLFWSLASSPVSSVLQMCGARPSGAAEVEAKRLLENLAIGAGTSHSQTLRNRFARPERLRGRYGSGAIGSRSHAGPVGIA